MGWPQWFMAIYFAFGLFLQIRDTARDRSRSSGWTTATIFLTIALSFGVVLVMHAGRFW